MLVIYSILSVVSCITVPVPNHPEPGELTAEEAVQKWVAAYQNAGPIEGSFRSYKFDHVFKAEIRSTGRYRIAGNQQWRFDFQPDPGIKLEQVHEIQGKKYKLEIGKARSIARVGDVFTERHEDRTMTTLTDAAAKGPLAKALFKGYAEFPANLGLAPYDMDLMNSYRVEIGDLKDRGIHLKLYPVSTERRRSLEMVEVLLNLESFQINAIKIHWPSGNQSTVYTFSDHASHVELTDEDFDLQIQ